MRRTTIKEVERTSPARVEDLARFYVHIEISGVETMKDFLRRELGVKVPILGTQNYAGMPSMLAQDAADWIDNHAYWGHPSFYEGRRAQSLLRARTLSSLQNPVIQDRPGPGGDVTLLVDTTDSRVAGRPYTITEWAGSKVNPYAWEVPHVFSAYPQFHDVDGLFQFAFAQENTDWRLGPMSAHLTWSNVRPYLVLHAVAGLAWRRGDLAPAQEKIRLNYSEADIYSVANGTPATFYWWGKDIPSWAPYVVPFERALLSSAKDSGPLHLLKARIRSSIAPPPASCCGMRESRPRRTS